MSITKKRKNPHIIDKAVFCLFGHRFVRFRRQQSGNITFITKTKRTFIPISKQKRINRKNPIMDDVKDMSIIVKWCGKEYIISDLIDNDTVAVLRHEM